MTVPRLPRPKQTVTAGEFARHAGGKGANQTLAAARAGAKVTFIGAHGADDFGRDAKAGLRREGVDVQFFLEKKGEQSGVALILVGGRSRENVIAVARSANDRLSAEDVHAAEARFRRADVVLAQQEVPTEAVEAAAELAARHEVPFVLNPAPARKIPQRIMRRVFALTPNEEEVRLLTGEADIRTGARVLLRRGCASVAVTLGARGVLLCDGTGERFIRAPKVQAVDTVGAGDCFSAWLAVGIAEGLSMQTAVERAVRMASIAVTRSGAQAGMPWRREL